MDANAPIGVDRAPKLELDQLEVLAALDSDELVMLPAFHDLAALHHANFVRVPVAERLLWTHDGPARVDMDERSEQRRKLP